ncbi:MAG: hypothetical protein ACFE8E_06410 [Candidatus Hodarchaeota archaeon]
MDKLNNKEEKFEHNDSYLTKLYKDLTNAISSSDYQSIWELSKTITRYHFKKLNDQYFE